MEATMLGLFARVGIVAWAAALNATEYTTASHGKPKFSWEKLEPSSKLEWVDCNTNRQCARFKLPLNYADPNDTRSAIIAIIRIPSPLVGTDEYRGPILLNPGGPGGSGIDLVEEVGNEISTIVGPQFDVISFDPRGVSRSRPRVSFYESCEEGKKWGEERRSLNSSSHAYANSYGLVQLRNSMAQDRDLGGELKFVTTNLVARDMLEITQAMGFEKLKYWGFSYGSVLGATFAAMFPEKVERLIMDGVMDAETYYSTLWDKNLVDTDLTLSYFFNDCAAAGPEACAFYDKTPELIKENLAALTASIRERPIPVVIHGERKMTYGLVDYDMLRDLVFHTLYNPVKFPRLATALADLQKGNGTTLLLASGLAEDCGCRPTAFEKTNIVEAIRAISCTDGAPVSNISYDDLLSRYTGLRDNVTEWYEFWDYTMACSGWKVKPPPRFTGPFIANTSHPLLLIGNTADPVTPLRSAHKMSKGFTGSVVLQQDSPGHCSLSAVSVCTAKYVRAYFMNGTLPAAGTVCGVDTKLFPLPEPDLEMQDVFVQTVLRGGREDWDLLQALKDVNTVF